MMSEKWEWVTLDKLGKFIRGKQTHYPKNDLQLFYNGEISFIEIQDIRNSKIFIKKVKKFYNQRGLKQGKLFPINTVCISSEGNIADSALLSKPSCLSCHIHGFNSFSGISDPKFIKYCFDFQEVKRFALALSIATTRLSLTTEKLLKVKFPKPPLEVQQKIGNILANYDLILDNHEKQIELLKKLKKSLFKEWFIKLRFPEYENYTIWGVTWRMTKS